MKRLVVLATTAALAGALAIPAFAATKSITVGDNYFVKKGSQPTVTVKRNTTLRFVWRGRNPHNVLANRRGRKVFQSPVKTNGTYRKKVTRRGTYSVFCTIHGGMTMRLRVR